tara:strand:+ start:1479 stop:1874 length:396 start_codon:yes stop_codon:yes gene_type:complete
MQDIDHIALQVKGNMKESVNFYCNKYNAKILYEDETWAYLQFKNIKLALVTEDEHPYHIAFKYSAVMNGKKHRDGTESEYFQDPSGNTIEHIVYPESDKFGDYRDETPQYDFCENELPRWPGLDAINKEWV